MVSFGTAEAFVGEWHAHGTEWLLASVLCKRSHRLIVSCKGSEALTGLTRKCKNLFVRTCKRVSADFT